LQIAAKQLQLATWLLLTAYRNLPTPYPTVPSPTLYDVSFSHNTKRYRRQTDRTSYHKREHHVRSAKNYGAVITTWSQYSLYNLSYYNAAVYIQNAQTLHWLARN